MHTLGSQFTKLLRAIYTKEDRRLQKSDEREREEKKNPQKYKAKQL
jgi:hypothetical protein